MSLLLVDGGSIPIVGYYGEGFIIEKMYFQDLEDISAYENEDGFVIPAVVDFDTVKFTRRRIYFMLAQEGDSDSGTLPEQEESEEGCSDADLANMELAADLEDEEFSEEESESFSE